MSYCSFVESVLVIRSFGIQVETEYSSGTTTVKFYPADLIHSIIINEGISMVSLFSQLGSLFNVFIAVLVNDALIGAFQFLLKRLDTQKNAVNFFSIVPFGQ